MNYFEAVQVGRKRVNAAIELLQPLAGVCHPMLFLKMGVHDWTPVGEEMLYALIPGKNSTVALAMCDADGNAKTMSDWLTVSAAEEIVMTLSSRGITRFDGEVRLPI